MIRVLLADDQRLVRAGFRMILSPEPDLEVVGEASDGVEAVDLADAVSDCLASAWATEVADVEIVERGAEIRHATAVLAEAADERAPGRNQ